MTLPAWIRASFGWWPAEVLIWDAWAAVKHRFAVHRRGQQGEVSWRDRGAARRSGMERGGPGCEPSAPVAQLHRPEVLRVRSTGWGRSTVRIFRRRTGLRGWRLSPSSTRGSPLLPRSLFSDNFGGKDFHLWEEFVSSFLNLETESSKVLMCVFIYLFIF